MKVCPLFLAALVFPFSLSAQSDSIPADDPVLQRIDALSNLPWVRHDPFTTDVSKLNTHGFAPDSIPVYTPEVYRQRVLALDQNTPFKLTYNAKVQAYIDLYAVRKRDQTARMLGMAQHYFPVFEQALDRYGLPQELKYLAVVESALCPDARSRASAVGLWQFMVSTAKLYGLRVDSYVDERSDVYKSTDAACRYLKDLYDVFGDWGLALAAYNCGPGNVNKAVRRAGGAMDYWKIYGHLPRETRGYVPAFIAVNYIFNHAADHNIYPVAPNYCAYEVDTVHVNYPVELGQLARIIGADSATLCDLNPVFRRGFIPRMDSPATVYIPQSLVASFIDHEDSISRSYVPDLSTPAPATLTASRRSHGRTSTHRVRRGESLSVIAERYGVSVHQLREWNHLRSNRIKAGQRLVLRRVQPDGETTAQTDRHAASAASGGKEYIYHTIQPGDTLWDIAQEYPGVTVDDLKRLNRGMNVHHLTPGKKIKIGVDKG